jgi:prepilin signal peptidase PulO-like enzyme (type II secretory pathway)
VIIALLILILLISSALLNSLIHYIPAKLFYDKEIEAHEVLAPVQMNLPSKPKFRVILPFSGILRVFLRFKANWQAFLTDLILIAYNLSLYFYFGFTWGLAIYYFFGVALLGLSVIDFNHYILPDIVTLPLLWLGLLINAYTWIVPLKSAVLGAIIGYLILWLIYHGFKLLTGKGGMGYGDFKLLAVIGAWFGVGAVVYVMLFSALVGIALGMVLKLFDKGISVLPFGVALSLGWLLYFVFLHKSYVLVAF